MADSWFALWFFGRAPLEEAIPTAKNAAARALELDPTLGEAHGVLGAASLYADWSWRRAAPSLRRAVELSPNEATVRHYYADYLLVTDDVEGSLREVQIGAQLDPVSPLATLAVVGHLLSAHRFDDVIDECRRLLELFPGHPQAHRFLASSYWHKEMFEEALVNYELARLPKPLTNALKRGYAEGGDAGAMMAALEVLRSRPGPPRPLDLARYAARAGADEEALDWLEKAYERRIPQLLHVKHHPDYAHLQGNPRFEDLMSRIGFP